MRVDRALTRGDAVAPDLLEQTCSPEDGAGCLCEPVEEVELSRGQVYVLPVAANAPSRGIDEERAEPDRPLLRPRGTVNPAKEGAHPGNELARAERLRHIVVSTDCEPDLEIGLGVPGGEHEHRHRSVPLDAAANLEAVEPGQHEVEHDQVGPEATAEVDAG